MFGKILSAFVAGLAVASAVTPVFDPTSNPIGTPGLNQIVPVGTPFTITWNPTTPTTGTVTIVLLRGPSTNVVPLYTIAQSVPNSGSFVWNPATDLVADTSHYGLQLIVDATGQFQYSTQFGISNSNQVSSSSSSSASSSSTASSTASGSSTASASGSSSGSASPTASVQPTYTISYSATGTGSGNATVVQPTVPLSVPTTLQGGNPTVKPAAPLQATGAAHKMAASFGGAAIAVVAAVAAL